MKKYLVLLVLVLAACEGVAPGYGESPVRDSTTPRVAVPDAEVSDFGPDVTIIRAWDAAPRVDVAVDAAPVVVCERLGIGYMLCVWL